MTHSMKAIQTLMRTSALNGHPHAEACIDSDRGVVDVARLIDFGWSSGELVLVGLVRAFYGGWSDMDISDIAKLDTDNRRAATLALRVWLGEEAAE
jgi:hypothetical protein